MMSLRKMAIAALIAADASSERPRFCKQLSQAPKMPSVAGPDPRQFPEDGDRLVRLATRVQGMCELMSDFGPDRARGGVESDRFVSASQLFQALCQVVVEPDVARKAALGLAEDGLASCGSPASRRADPSKSRLIAGSSSTWAERASLRRASSLSLGGCGLEASRSRLRQGSGSAARAASSRRSRAGPIVPFVAAHPRPVVQRRRQGHGDSGRPALDSGTDLVGGRAARVKLSVAESICIRRVGARPVGIVFRGRANVDQRIEKQSDRSRLRGRRPSPTARAPVTRSRVALSRASARSRSTACAASRAARQRARSPPLRFASLCRTSASRSARSTCACCSGTLPLEHGVAAAGGQDQD